ncbi:MAG: hypothetical protein KIT79_06490 [Deltaproteobacteria bacterium]|nr:hypothetical protein [Deltaproteobacteria bacterium]
MLKSSISFLGAALVAVTITACGSSGGRNGFPQGLYIADGKEGEIGRLYLVDETTGDVLETIGDLPACITALALSPDGSIYGTTCGAAPNSHLNLLYRLTYLGEDDSVDVKKVGAIDFGDEDEADAISGLAFIGDVLYGWEGGTSAPRLFTIDTDTAEAELVGSDSDIDSYYGNSLAADSDGTLFAFEYIGTEKYMILDPDDGSVLEELGEVDYGTDGAYGVGDMTFIGDQLYGIEVDDSGVDDDDYPSGLVRINPETGKNTLITELPSSISALVYVP